MLIADDAVLTPLVLAVQRGDSQAWEQLAALYHPLLSQSPESFKPPFWPHCPFVDSDDFAYRLRAILFDLAREYDPARCDSVGAYVAVQFRHRAQNYLRGIARRARHYVRLDTSLVEYIHAIPGASPQWETPCGRDPRLELIQAAMANLAPRQRQVLIRFYQGDQSLKEIAVAMRMSHMAARQLKSRAERQLRRDLGVQRPLERAKAG
jgi:RNA polymerase sigma factor (sigma-70 family)